MHLFVYLPLLSFPPQDSPDGYDCARSSRAPAKLEHDQHLTHVRTSSLFLDGRGPGVHPESGRIPGIRLGGPQHVRLPHRPLGSLEELQVQ